MFAVLAGLLVGTAPASAAGYVPISGAGSTWAANAVDAWRRAVAPAGIQVNYTAAGSTVGRNNFRDGVADFAVSDIPYGFQDGATNDPPPLRRFGYVPIAAGGIGLVYDLTIGGKRVTDLRLSGAAIAGIFTNTITMWNDPVIAGDNPDLALPAKPVVPVVRSDGSGPTAQFTQWLAATQSPAWTAYCQAVGRSPCTPTSAYPIAPNSAMIGQAGDLGVTSFVGQPASNGAIGYTNYSYALAAGLPVAKVLNAAGYYTAPTAGHVAVSLLNARINPDLTADLSQVYTDTDPRTYPLSGYSYLIVPTAVENNFNTTKGLTLADFGKYALCRGQNQVDALGYSALPIDLVRAGFSQLARIPGANVGNLDIGTCDNPTFSPDGTNTLAANDPFPSVCDRQRTTQCTPVATTVTLAAGPVTQDGTVTLTATVRTADTAGNDAVGDVQFSVGDAVLGRVPVTGGTATFTTPVSGVTAFRAFFAPHDLGAFAASASTVVTVTGPATVGGETLDVTIAGPVGHGVLAFDVDPTPITLTTPVDAGPELESQGALNPVTISDSRRPPFGWDASGSVSAFTDGPDTFGAGALGWSPTITTANPANDVTLGPVVQANNPGLGNPAALADAASGHGAGTTVLGAGLDLRVPFTTPAGNYHATITMTLISK